MSTQRGMKTGWSASGVLETPSTATPIPTKAVRLQVDFGEKRAEYYTLQFSLIPPPNVPSAVLLRARAQINWSVEGNFNRRELQVLNGTAVSGVGQGVAITLTDDSIDNIGLPTSVEYTASVQVAKGTRPNITHPPLFNPRTLDVVLGGPGIPGFPPYNIEAGSNSAMLIPQNAGITSVFFLATNIGAAPANPNDVSFTFRANGVQLAFADWDSRNIWLPLPPGTTDIEVTNTLLAGNDVRITPLYGIEG